MNIKEILAKLAKGEALTDEEKKTVAEFDPDKLAAAARKDGSKKVQELEAKLAEMQEQLESASNVGKTDAEKFKAEFEKAQKKLATMEAELNTTKADKAKFIRETKITGIMGKLKTVPGVDAEIVKMALAHKLAGVKDEELDSDDAVTPILTAFRTANKALILDESGHGTGTKQDGSNRSGGSGQVDPSKQSDAERLANLRSLK
jgi:alanyl-tRNA synthetase